MNLWLQYGINVVSRSSLIWSAFLFPFHLWTKEMITLLSASGQASTELEVPWKQKTCLLPQNLTLCLHICGMNLYFVFVSATFFAYTFCPWCYMCFLIGKFISCFSIKIKSPKHTLDLSGPRVLILHTQIQVIWFKPA